MTSVFVDSKSDYQNLTVFLLWEFFFSETNITGETVTGPINVSMSLAEFLKTQYDKTVRPNIDSGKKIANQLLSCLI